VTYLPQKAEKRKPISSEKPKNEKTDAEDSNFVKFTERWGYSYAVQPELTNAPALLTPEIHQPDLPQSISGHSALYFKNPDSKWRVLYRLQGLPVLMEKQIGKGTIVLSTITYFLSNEAMLRERHPGLILWLTGGKNEIIFDEYFHGMAKNVGVTALMRKYNLEITLLLLIILAVLYIWKNALPLVPVPETERRADVTSSLGKDSSAGLTNLLRRNIPMNKILTVSYAEWKKTVPARQPVSSEKLARIEAILTTEKKNPISAYNQISEVLKEK
jgi:hypothetical protein